MTSPKSIMGQIVTVSDALPVEQVKRATSWATGTTAAAGDTQLVAAPAAGSHITVTYLNIQNESAVATTIQLKDGSNARVRYLGQSQGANLSIAFEPGNEWRLTDATALNINLSGANSCGYSIQYYVEVTGQ